MDNILFKTDDERNTMLEAYKTFTGNELFSLKEIEDEQELVKMNILNFQTLLDFYKQKMDILQQLKEAELQKLNPTKSRYPKRLRK